VRHTPEIGGIMNGGPLGGKIMAYSGPLMPCYDDTGLRIGSYIWDEDHWEYESEQDDVDE
jgi:hypothetical protein